ncbi:hypothetical protein AN191_13080 [Loktanella sp. 5RATIMAR09]|nr:hypothetical protein AN191_13080 [Loktanella sp. 5RATIMAR09]
MSWKHFHDIAPDRISLFQYQKLKMLDVAEIERFGRALKVPKTCELISLFKYYDIDRMRNLEELGNRSNESAPGFIGTGYAPAEQAAIVDDTIRQHTPHWYSLMTEFGYST